MAVGFFGARDHIGGGTGALDKISSINGKDIGGTPYPLETDDAAMVIKPGRVDFYTYSAISMAVEDPINFVVVRPDDIDPANPGRWIIEYSTTSLGSEQLVQISNGIAALNGTGRYRLQVESGSADDLDKVTGLPDGHFAILVPDDGAKPITVKHGTSLKLQRGADFTMNNVRDKILLLAEGSDVCSEITRVSVE